MSMNCFINSQIMKSDFEIIHNMLKTENYIRDRNDTITFLKSSEQIDKRIGDYIRDKRTTTNTTFKLNELLEVTEANVTSTTARDELQEFNIFTEYKDISKLLKQYENQAMPKDVLIKKAEHKILKYVITCAIRDPINGDYASEDNNNLLREAGNILNDCGGINNMRECVEYFVIPFIPRRYRRDIDMLWDNIGDWRA